MEKRELFGRAEEVGKKLSRQNNEKSTKINALIFAINIYCALCALKLIIKRYKKCNFFSVPSKIKKTEITAIK